ncbi:hypothetical protein [Kitasatospora paranensis]|uniref:Integral membrane protein n=1 Tax=Kitasatospora paranensis TaxID=258053 RepID=A0ABW2G5F8_9ACTN
MYAPVPAPPRRRRAAQAGTVLLRIVLTVVPLVSLGMLGWITMLKPAIVHRRTRDWLLFGASAAASVGGIVLIGTSTGDTDWRATTGVVLLLGTAVVVPAYFLAVDLRPPRAPEPAPPARPPVGMPRPDRIGQVRAGLDELSAYLEQQERP